MCCRFSFFLSPVLLPDILKFELYHAWRNWEIVGLCQSVEQRSFQAKARCGVVITLHLLADLVAQFGKALEPDSFAKFIVNDHRQTMAHFLYIDRKKRLLSGQIRRGVIFGKGHVQATMLARTRPDQLVLEARNKAAGAEREVDGVAVALADDIAADRAAADIERVAVGGEELFGVKLKSGVGVPRP